MLRHHLICSVLHRCNPPNIPRQVLGDLTDGGGMGGEHGGELCPRYMNCLDESMSVWTNKFTCPGFMFIPCKPWPFGNEYHTICCCTSGSMWGIDLVEGKDHPRALGQQEFDNMGSTVGLLLWMLAPIFHKGYVVILDSGFCVLKAIIKLRKKGIFARTLIKK